MSQNNIDYGSFPDDPSADAIRTAFTKVQNNFTQLFAANANSAVTSINRTPGAGITVNNPTGNVIISANIACVKISTSSLSVGIGGNGGTNATMVTSAQTLVIDIDPAQVLSNYFASPSNGLAVFNGTLSSNSNAQSNITSLGTLLNLGVAGNITTSNLSITGTSNLGNSTTANYFIGSGNNLSNIQGANVTGAVAYATTANSVAVANVSGIGNIATINLDGNVSNILYGNGVFANSPVTYDNTNVATFLASYGSNTISTTGNVSVGNIIGNGQALTSLAGANVTGTVANATFATSAGSANSVAVANVSGIGNIATVNLDGNLSNILYGNGVFASAPITYGNSNVVTFLAAFGSNSISTTGNVSVGNIIGNGQALTDIAGNNVSGAVAYATTANSVAVANVSGIGNIATINFDGNVGNVLRGNGSWGPTVFANGAFTSNASCLLTVPGNMCAANVIVADYFLHSVATGITATGSTQGTAAEITKEINVVSTAAFGTGVVLPTAVEGMVITITNTSANSLLVYPATGAAINSLVANAALTQVTNATLQFVAPTTTQWYTT